MIESKYYLCNVYHSRINPVKHTFSYSVFYFSLDLDELENGKLDNYLFGYNKTRVISIRNTDYMGKENKSIKEKLLERFKLHQINNHDNIIDISLIKSIKLITNPRYFNYSFNPVNFYYCYDENKQLLQVVAEINNTFGETHLYFPTPTEFRDENLRYPFKQSVNRNPYLKRYSINKDFHVSPFNSLDGSYDFYFCDLEKCFDIRINLMSTLDKSTLNINHNEKPIQSTTTTTTTSFYDYIIMTRLWSTQDPFEINNSNIMKLLLTYPITAFKTVPRILYEAGRLHWGKKLKIYAKPNPPLENTTVLIQPSNNELTSLNFFKEYINKFKNINLELLLPDQNILKINTTTKGNEEPIKIQINNYEFFWKLFLNNKLSKKRSQPPLKAFSSKAIGLAFMCEDFTCSDLSKLLYQLCDLSISSLSPISSSLLNQETIDQSKIWNDLSEFINIENIQSFFLFNQETQNQNQFTFNSNQDFKEIIEKLNIKKQLSPSSSNINILEIGCNLSYYLLNENYLNNENIKLTILIESKELYEYHLQKFGNSFINIQIVNSKLSDFINIQKNDTTKFDSIISLDNSFNNIFDFKKYLISLKSISKIGSNLLIQNININKPNNQDDKPIRTSSFKNNYFKFIDEVGKKYWAIMANFQHNPFYLENRYMSLMNILLKPSKSTSIINCHILDENDDCCSTSQLNSFINNDNNQFNNHFKLKSTKTINNKSILEIVYQWLNQIQSNKTTFSIKLQEIAMRKGCLLKMNNVEIDEIYRAIYYHLTIIKTNFALNNLSINNYLIENK